MAKEFAKAFYKSAAWEQTRAYVISRARGLCERCYAKGKLTPGRIVHHKEPLTPENINDPSVALNPDKLVYLCHECHEEVHEELGVGAPNMPGPARKAEKELDKPRVGFDANGNIVKLR